MPSREPIARTPRPVLEEVTWSYVPRTEREAGDAIVRNFLWHWFPNKVTKAALSVRYSLWLGTISAVLFFYLAVSGAALMFLYVPSVERAYASVKDLEYVVSFGGFLRASHRIAAHLMVLTVFLHMVRVFLTGAYKNGGLARQFRQYNWWIGVALLLCTLALSFTGYLLPWDQLAYWAITVGTNIADAVPLVGQKMRFLLLGGHEINQSTLIRFYVLHCFFVPSILAALYAWHMWRIRKDGGLACHDHLALTERERPVEPSRAKTYALLGITASTSAAVDAAHVDEEQYKVLAVPVLGRRILIVSLATLAVVAILALVLGAPLEEAANPRVTPNPAKAPWYVLGLQELVTVTTIHIGSFTVSGALIGGVLVPGVLLVLALGAPFGDRSGAEAVGVWLHRARRRYDIAFIAVCVVLVALTIVGTYLRGPYWGFYWPWETWPTPPPKL